MAMNCYPDAKWPDPLEVGRQYQDFAVDALASINVILQNYTSKKYQYQKGENIQRWEIKFDHWWSKSRRLSIEIAEKTRANQDNWIPSGIYRPDSWLYIQGNYSGLFIFFTHFLRQLHKSGRYEEKEEPTLKSFYLPIGEAKRYGHFLDTKNFPKPKGYISDELLGPSCEF